MLYNIPGRCGVDIAAETVARIQGDCPNVVSIKEAGGNVDRVSELRARLPDAFTVLSGDDGLTLPFLAAGAVGVVSVASNLLPREMCEPGRRFREWRSQAGGGIASQTLLVVQRFVYRTESGSDKDRIVVAWDNLGGSAVAALRNECRKSGAFAQNPGEI